MVYDYIGTFTNKKFHFMNPSVDEICIEDIAQALSMNCRYSGHVKDFYSVAEHSVIIADLVYKQTGSSSKALAALLHDASEAYLTDIPRPIKPYLTNYVDMESNIEKVIQQKFNIPPMDELTKYLDTHIVGAEAKILFNTVPDWASDYDDIPIGILNLEPKFARVSFLTAFKMYSREKTQ
tara:strand:- start:203 stop:742 length:540 start_codon:yes stop_codon:yes gene_type:complete